MSSPSTPSRRTFLTTLGGGLVALAGCTGAPPSGATDSSTPKSTEKTPAQTVTSRPTDTPETPEIPTSPRWESVELTATGTGCGETPSVEFVETGARIRLVGTLVVSSLCYRATLRTATVVDNTARLVVVPGLVTTDGTPACGQCIADATFEVDGAFAGGRPTELVVELRGYEPRTVRTDL